MTPDRERGAESGERQDANGNTVGLAVPDAGSATTRRPCRRREDVVARRRIYAMRGTGSTAYTATSRESPMEDAETRKMWVLVDKDLDQNAQLRAALDGGLHVTKPIPAYQWLTPVRVVVTIAALERTR